jgi:Mrp family chromosome partitioning ATPase
MSGRALRPVPATSDAISSSLQDRPSARPGVATPIVTTSDLDDPLHDDGFVYAEPHSYGVLASDVDGNDAEQVVPAGLPDAEPVRAVYLPLPVAVASAAASSASVEEGDGWLDEATPADAFSVRAVANHLIARRREIVACVSPQGDEASAGAVMLARAMSGSGRRALLIDLTASAVPTELMADNSHLPGITNLLSAEVSIAEAIHADRLSSADIIPQGNADPALAMRGAGRMPMIVEALVNAYDAVILECGQTDIGALKRIAGTLDMTYVLSCTHMDEDVIAAQVEEFFAHGHRDVLLLSTSDHADGSRADNAA